MQRVTEKINKKYFTFYKSQPKKLHMHAFANRNTRPRGDHTRPPPTHPHFFPEQKKETNEKKKEFQGRYIKMLSSRSKWNCFNHSRASRIYNFFMSVNHGDRQYFPWPIHFEIHFVGLKLTKD